MMSHTPDMCSINDFKRCLENAGVLIENLNCSFKRCERRFLDECGKSEALRAALEDFVLAYYNGRIGAVPDVPPAFVPFDAPYPSPIVNRNLLEDLVKSAKKTLSSIDMPDTDDDAGNPIFNDEEAMALIQFLRKRGYGADEVYKVMEAQS